MYTTKATTTTLAISQILNNPTFTGAVTMPSLNVATTLTSGSLNTGNLSAAGLLNANGGISTTNITVSGTDTHTGLLTANGGINTTTITASGLVNANGGISINNYVLPLFNNGSFSGSSRVVIPISFTSSSYNYAEVKVQFLTSTQCNITLSGNTASNGSGTSLAVQENGEITIQHTAQNTPVYTTTGVVATNVTGQVQAGNINYQFTIKITKFASGGTFLRNYYSFETIYGWYTVGTARVNGMGHLDSSSLASIVLTCSTGNIGGTYSTIHYY
jgi:hypothetical protein